MSGEPKRLLDGGGSELERLLLASALSARPKPWTRWRAAVLFSFAALGTMSVVKAALATAAKLPAGAVRWTGIGLGTSALVLTGAQLIDRGDASPTPTNVASVAPGDVSPRLLDAPPSALTPPSAAAVVPAAETPKVTLPEAKTAPASTAKAPSATLTRELELLDRASRALSSGHARQALKELELYRRTSPRKVMAEEALRLRVEATLAAGDPASARLLRQEFSRRYPNSAYAQRLRSLLP